MGKSCEWFRRMDRLFWKKSHLSGVVFAGGVTDPGEIQGHQSLKRAFEMGKNIR